jgi:MFS family permease
MLILIFFCIVAGNSTLVFYGPSIVKSVGITDLKTLGWVMSLIYACGWIGMVGNGWLSDRKRKCAGTRRLPPWALSGWC